MTIKTVIFSILFSFSITLVNATEKYRVVIMTDMTHDDGNSLIRYLYYSNEFDTEAIIITPQLPDYNYNSTGPWEKVTSILEAYSTEYNQLKKHHSDYPTPESLVNVTKKGRGAIPIMFLTNAGKFAGPIADRYVESEWGEINFPDWIGEGNTPNGEPKDSEGSEYLQDIFDKDDDRPIFVQMWGGPITFVQALYRYKQRNSEEKFKKLMSKLHVFGILLQDITFDYLIDLDQVNNQTCTDLQDVKSTYDGERVSPKFLLHDQGHFWHYVFGRDEDYIKPMVPNEVNGHGPMSDIFDNGGEGDTPSFLYLLSANRGLNDPLDPTHGSWGSLFVPMGESFPPGYYHTCGVENNELKRWVADAKLSFENRLDYSLKNPDEVNHEPIPMINGKNNNEIEVLQISSGSTIQLDASESFDPDGNKIGYNWFFYKEASTIKELPLIRDPSAEEIKIKIPEVVNDGSIHLILEVKDSASTSLKSYKRIIFEIKK